METNQTQAPTKLTMPELQALVISLEARVKVLETPKASGSPREMTVEDANRVMPGDLKDEKHQKAADTLGLSYGQVYSFRLGYTFKGIHKEMKEKGIKNPWIK